MSRHSPVPVVVLVVSVVAVVAAAVIAAAVVVRLCASPAATATITVEASNRKRETGHEM